MIYSTHTYDWSNISKTLLLLVKIRGSWLTNMYSSHTNIIETLVGEYDKLCDTEPSQVCVSHSNYGSTKSSSNPTSHIIAPKPSFDFCASFPLTWVNKLNVETKEKKTKTLRDQL